ncbi:hypothetical protein GXP67_00875 [Rhodocytophaga rosea]|uniref:Uncharacterized protein n=1 Tax=Rhodocytophaga rosea TaxID=2704465 RepID=A0A6C0GBK9_9BACT|nr:hypothetical protein [Rhodocytophaga rosea]QHT65326.1 hypothetical protein GXP67_00875 [Rhodocytophaga rosea]
MGTGSFGTGGGRAGGGGGFGMSSFVSLRTSADDKTRRQVIHRGAQEVFEKLSSVGKSYFKDQISNSLVRGVYSSLFDLSRELRIVRSWSTTQTFDKVDGGPGCLQNWVNKVIKENAGKENSKVKGVVRMALESFVLRALGDNLDVYIDGDIDDVRKHLNYNVFQSISGYFLGFVLYELLKRESEGMNDFDQDCLREIAQAKANQLIKDFEDKFLHNKHEELNINQITYSNLFDLFACEYKWFSSYFETPASNILS